MATPPIPIQRYLVPAGKPTVPDEFTGITETITGSLPYTIQLERELVLLVVAPNGLANTWRDADPTAVVSRSDEEVSSFLPDGNEIIGDVARAPLRLIARAAGRTLAAVPLVAHRQVVLPDSGALGRGVEIEVVVRSWDLRAGNLRGPGDYGSRISLAWRRANRAVDRFSTPPINPQLVPRLEPKFRMFSVLGSRRKLRLARFAHVKVVRK